jgi:phosphate transport system substrate-binding protein
VKDDERQGGHGLRGIEIPETVAKTGEEERRRLSRRAGHGQQRAGDYARSGRRQDELQRDPPPRESKRQPGFTQAGRDQTHGSGTTYHFTDYLGKVSADWKAKVGVAKAVQWPAGIGGKGNDGVQTVKQTEGAIGYVELAYVVQTGMQQAFMKNKGGKFVQASVAGATAAAAQKSGVSPTSFSITDEPGDTSYPIAGFSWIIVRTSISDATKAKAVVFLLKWLVTDGQQYGKDLQYAPLPKAVQELALDTLKRVASGGAAVLS